MESSGKKEDGDEEKKDEKSNKQQPLPGNGGVGPAYWWQQTLEEVTMFITVPDNIRARDLEVKIETEKLRVAVKG